MTNFSNYYYLVILLNFRITIGKADNSNTSETPIEIEDSDVSQSVDEFSYVCKLPIEEGEDCRYESLATNKANYIDNAINEILEFNDIIEVIDLNEVDESNERNERNELSESNISNTLYFGYNKSTKKCEQFNFDGCGGNKNRFDTIEECRKTCYTPLKNFLAKVTDILVFRVTNDTSELPAT